MSNDHKVIGLLGGMSWPSTVTYYQQLNKHVHARLGASHSARVLIWSDDYQNVERMQLNGQWAEAGAWLAQGARRLEAGGADLIAIACNTMHKVASAVRESIAVPLVDLIEAAAIEAAARRCTTVAILGTRFTVSMGRYEDELSRRGIGTLLPSAGDQAVVDDIIYEELCRGKVEMRSRQRLNDVIQRLADGGADAVLLACTELSLLIDEPSCAGGLRVIDSTMSHVHRLVEASLGPSHQKEVAENPAASCEIHTL